MIVWVDLETSGLNPDKDVLLELGYIFTDDNLNEIRRGSTVVHCEPELRAGCHDVVREMHDRSGLWDECYASDHSAAWVDAQFAKGLAKIADEESGKPTLAGSSIHFDRRFMEAHLPKTLAQLHYRQIDVSSWKGVIERIHPNLEFEPGKSPNIKPHRALPDLDHSIAELKHYLQFIKEPADG